MAQPRISTKAHWPPVLRAPEVSPRRPAGSEMPESMTGESAKKDQHATSSAPSPAIAELTQWPAIAGDGGAYWLRKLVFFADRRSSIPGISEPAGRAAITSGSSQHGRQ